MPVTPPIVTTSPLPDCDTPATQSGRVVPEVRGPDWSGAPGLMANPVWKVKSDPNVHPPRIASTTGLASLPNVRPFPNGRSYVTYPLNKLATSAMHRP